MKILPIGLAVTFLSTVSTIALAETPDFTLYGRANLAVATHQGDNKDQTGIASDASRFGFKGTFGLTDELNARYHYEMRFNADGDDRGRAGGIVEHRLGYVGLFGQFGEVRIGKQYTPTFEQIDTMTLTGNAFTTAHGFPMGIGVESVKYIKKFDKGGQFSAMIREDQTGEDLKGYSVGVTVPVGPVKFAASVNDDDKGQDVALGAKYKSRNGLELAAVRKQLGNHLGGTTDENVNVLFAAQTFGKHKFAARYTELEEKGTSGVGFGYHYKFNKRGSLYVEHSPEELSDSTHIGLRYDFSKSW